MKQNETVIERMLKTQRNVALLLRNLHFVIFPQIPATAEGNFLEFNSGHLVCLFFVCLSASPFVSSSVVMEGAGSFFHSRRK